MKLLLLQDVENLGETGDLVTVKAGYGRNYLIPRKMARLATESMIRQQDEIRRQQARKIARIEEDAERLKQQLEEVRVVVAARTGEENRIFGTVTSQQIASQLTKQGFEIDRRSIELDEDVRMIGVYTATVKLVRNVSAKVTVEVVPESGGGSE